MKNSIKERLRKEEFGKLRTFDPGDRIRRSADIYYFFIKVKKCSTSFFDPTTNVVLS